MGVAAAVLVLFGAGFWMLSVLQQQKTDRQAFERHFEPIAPQQLGQINDQTDGQPAGQTAGQTESGAYTEQLAPGPGNPSPEQLQRPNAGKTGPGYALPPNKAAIQENSTLTEDAGMGVSDEPMFEFAPADNDFRFMPESSSKDAFSGAGDDATSFGRTADSDQAGEKKAASDAAVERPQVSSQAAPKSLVLEDARKQENVISIKGSRQKTPQPGDFQAGAAGQAPAAAPIASDDLDFNQKESPEAVDLSTEMEDSRQESVSEVSIAASSNRGYKPAPDPYEQGQNAYASGDYRMATEWLSKVPAGHPQAKAADLLEANAWLERDKPEKAIPLLEGLKALGPGPLYDQCRWYLALAHIAQGDEDPAMALLEALILENGPYRDRALELMSDLSD
jgi:hypothetical protein